MPKKLLPKKLDPKIVKQRIEAAKNKQEIKRKEGEGKLRERVEETKHKMERDASRKS
jgi:hypothetical protein